MGKPAPATGHDEVRNNTERQPPHYKRFRIQGVLHRGWNVNRGVVN